MIRDFWDWWSALRATLALGGIALVGAGSYGTAQQVQRGGEQVEDHNRQAGQGKVEILHVQGNVYMISGAGANITVQVGDEVVIVVDAGMPQQSDDVLAAIRSVTDKHILFIINTSADQDHTGGNESLSKAGWALPFTARSPLQKQGEDRFLMAPGASIIAHYNVLERMSATSGKEPLVPSALWPTDTYDTRYWRLYNNEGVWIYHPANAHTDGDSYVLFRKSDVVSAGDILNLASYPVIRADQGGSIDGVIAALNQIIEFMQPEAKEEGGTYVVPGHGHICDRHDVVDYRDMVTIIRGRIQYYIKQGMTLEEVKAAKPTLDYDGLYGATTGPWTSDMFVEAVYRELSKVKSKNQEEQNRGGGK
ncbi:MAG: MBL fold metallo-hydrolase [Candidatus Acidiferrales bacterium]|jgi:glyoxylase-like metal-dependent hydrolase (beta-lactamase superfamily II)